jgi:3-deoxy-D-manno-octulosonic acid kinase
MDATRIVPTPGGALLFDARRLRDAPRAEWLDVAWWRAHAPSREPAGGRGAALLVDGPFGAAVLRHYRRGGWVARLSADRYVYTGAERTRAFREFRLLDAMTRLGLPVPAPLAARYVRSGPFYRADILVAAIPAARTLAQRVAAGGSVPWSAIGACIARFHDAGIRHADLNAHNVLIDVDERVWLIDFDRAERRPRAAHWQRANLARLARSLRKIGAPERVADFERGWDELARAHAAGAH